ncbi:hypothetical protein MRX96_011589 [Rhipicephalus microplus]
MEFLKYRALVSRARSEKRANLFLLTPTPVVQSGGWERRRGPPSIKDAPEAHRAAATSREGGERDESRECSDDGGSPGCSPCGWRCGWPAVPKPSCSECCYAGAPWAP